MCQGSLSTKSSVSLNPHALTNSMRLEKQKSFAPATWSSLNSTTESFQKCNSITYTTLKNPQIKSKSNASKRNIEMFPVLEWCKRKNARNKKHNASNMEHLIKKNFTIQCTASKSNVVEWQLELQYILWNAHKNIWFLPSIKWTLITTSSIIIRKYTKSFKWAFSYNCQLRKLRASH